MFGRGSGGESGHRGFERAVQRLVARQARVVERIDENRIEEAAIRGIIRARAFPVVREQHVQRAHAEIGRPRAAGLLARERQRREVADPLIAMILVRAPQGVELGGDAEPFAQSRLRAVSLGRNDGQRAFDAVRNEPVAADRQRRQRDSALGDGASVGQFARNAVRGLDPPLDGLAILAFDARVGPIAACRAAARPAARRRAARARRAGGGARFVDDARQALARLSFAGGVEAERRQKRDLGLRRNDRALARDVKPFRRDSGRACELVDRLEAGRSGTQARRPPSAPPRE